MTIESKPLRKKYSESESNSSGNIRSSDEIRWKLIQLNTFTRWINEHLKCVNKKIENLKTDFCDGIKLAALLSILSQKEGLTVNQRPNFRTQQLENITNCMKFIEEIEHIKIVNIDSSDIVDGNLKLIMGLVWTLILHYAISMPVWEDCGNDTNGEKISPKKRLLNWIKNKVPGKKINNFTTDWNDGIALGALVDSCYPGLCPDWEDWAPVDNFRNATDAMDLAENWLEVPKLITPEEIINPNVDEQSVMTYLSNYPHMNQVKNAPLRARCCPQRVVVHGKGLMDEGNVAKQEVEFVIDTSEAGQGDLLVSIKDLKNQNVEFKMSQDYNLPTIFIVKYTPLKKGVLNISILYANKHIANSPFNVFVSERNVLVSDLTMDGSIFTNRKIRVGEDHFLNIKGDVDILQDITVKIMDSNDVSVNIVKEVANNTVKHSFKFNQTGNYKLQASHLNNTLKLAPVNIIVLPDIYPDRCIITGRGVVEKGIRVNDKVSFSVDCTDCGPSDTIFSVEITSPTNEEISVDITRQDSIYNVEYVPKQVGVYKVVSKYGNEQIKKVYPVSILKCIKSNIMVYGSGIENGQVNKNCTFTVDSNNEAINLAFDIKGPSHAKINAKEVDDQTVDFSYVPTVAGEYELHILNNNEDVPNSPWLVKIKDELPNFYIENVFITHKGKPIDELDLVENETCVFEINLDSIKNVKSDIQIGIRVLDDNYNFLPVMSDNCTFSFTPKSEGKVRLLVDIEGCAVKNSPFRFNVNKSCDLTKVLVYGPAIDKIITHIEDAYFYIDSSLAGKGTISILLMDEFGQNVKHYVKNERVSGKDIMTVDIDNQFAGEYRLNVFMNQTEIVNSPFKVLFENDINFIHVRHPKKFIVGTKFQYDVDLGRLTFIEKSLKMIGTFTDPNDNVIDASVYKISDTHYKVSFTVPRPGEGIVVLKYNSLTFTEFPKKVFVNYKTDSSKIVLSGNGLTGVTDIGKENTIIVNLEKAGPGEFSIKSEGVKAEFDIVGDDNVKTVVYKTLECGQLKFDLLYDSEIVPNGSFKIRSDYTFDPEKVKITEPPMFNINEMTEIVIDTTYAGESCIEVTVLDLSNNKKIACQITTDSSSKFYYVKFLVPKSGFFELDCTYGGLPISKGKVQFRVPVKEPVVKIEKIKVESSPREISFTDESCQDIEITGEAFDSKNIYATIPTSFMVNTSKVKKGDITVNIYDEKKNEIPSKTTYIGDSQVLFIKFSANKVGYVYIDILFNNKPLTKSFKKKVLPTGNANEVMLPKVTSKIVPINTTTCIKVDISRAGKGHLYVEAQNEGVNIPINIITDDKGISNISYVPESCGLYEMEFSFGGVLIPEKIRQKAVSKDEYYMYVSRNMFNEIDDINQNVILNTFIIPADIDNLNLSITDQYEEYPAFYYENLDSTVTVLGPTVEGSYNLNFKCAEKDCNINFTVYSKTENDVIAYGDGLSHGYVDKPAIMHVQIPINKDGSIDIEIEGPAKVASSCVNESNCLYEFKYTPTKQGVYMITIKFNKMNVANSPFRALIFPKIEPIYQSIDLKNCIKFVYLNNSKNLDNCVAGVKCPTDEVVVLDLKTAKHKLVGSFPKTACGSYIVGFYNYLDDEKVYFDVPLNLLDVFIDLSRIVVQGLDKNKINTLKSDNSQNKFVLDASKVPVAPLGLAIDGPAQCKIFSKKLDNNIYEIYYTIFGQGNFEVTINYNGQILPDCPYIIKSLSDETASPIVYKVSNSDSQILKEHVNGTSDLCRLLIKFSGTIPNNAKAIVQCPSGCIEPCDIRKIDDGDNFVIFYAKEVGEHLISIKIDKTHIEGSPFVYFVSENINLGWKSIKVYGDGLENAVVNEKGTFFINTQSAGNNGHININIEGPSRTLLDFNDKDPGLMVVSYKCSKPGKYAIRVTYDGNEILGSPFTLCVQDSIQNGHNNENGVNGEKVDVDDQDFVCMDMRPSHAIFTLKDIKTKNLKAFVLSPSNKIIDAQIKSDFENQCSIVFLPFEKGVHKLFIKDVCTGQDLPDCPYIINITNICDSSAIQISGDGISGGLIDVQNYFKITTNNAGHGNLSVDVTGPSKVLLETKECSNGCEIFYTPYKPGVYKIFIKYNNININGSPFHVNVLSDKNEMNTHSSDSNYEEIYSSQITTGKVQLNGNNVNHNGSNEITVSGDALSTAIVGKVMKVKIKSTDQIDNEFMVGMKGPANPFDKIHIDRVSNCTYEISYTVSQKGNYLFSILWGGSHIKGSPFSVVAV
ncbi:hypothetical protein A3Q56_02617 [Intoshia linei]|uniref:Calponin-homology (CH) domain-containing protein n=1 Tax=Intoshia linei TaxID=1819745 RepID=A0A177B5Q8_9BILA|nr:hypothetical protein A3Q56_02617 [Intoshia linei]